MREQTTEALTNAEIGRALEYYVVYHGAIHAEGCPEDDTCDCPYREVNAATNEAVRRLKGESQHAPVPSQWQSIETAPKDGTRVLLHRHGFAESMAVGWWESGEWSVAAGLAIYHGATHWMPLPAPPVQE